MIRLVVDGDTDVGRVRERNEDAFVIEAEQQVFIVCDGMGGHNAGDVASREAAAEARRFLLNRLAEWDSGDEEEDDGEEPQSERERMIATVRGAMLKACAHVYNMAQTDSEMSGMGCTMTLLVLRGARGYIAHVGDCRLWLIRDGKANLFTEDHRVVVELLAKGELTEEQARDFPFPNSLSRSVGVHPMVNVDTIDFDVLEKDRFLICSDGLHEYLDTPDVETLVWAPADIMGLPKALIANANEQGGRDNITAICIDIQEVEEEGTQVSVETLNMFDYISKMPVFVDFDYRELTAFLNHTTSVDYQAGDEIFSEGDAPGGLHVLLFGNVEVSKGGVRLNEVADGGILGAASFLVDQPHSSSAQAVAATRTLQVDALELRELLQAETRLATKLMTAFAITMARRIHGEA